MKNREDEEDKAAESQAESQEAPQNEADLDFESMDLSVETVEERISPSETNVFDK